MPKDVDDLTPEQLDKIIRDIKAIPAEPIGPHLTREEMTSWVMGDPKNPVDYKRQEEHVASCRDCCIKLDELFTHFSQLDTLMHEGIITSADLRERILAELERRERHAVILFKTEKRP